MDTTTEKKPTLSFDSDQHLQLLRLLAHMPWSGMLHPRLELTSGPDDVIAWLQGFRDELIRSAHEVERDRAKLRDLEHDVAAVRRLFGTEEQS